MLVYFIFYGTYNSMWKDVGSNPGDLSNIHDVFRNFNKIM